MILWRAPEEPEQRLVADRSGLNYPSDLTDTEWAIMEPMIPLGRHDGRKDRSQREASDLCTYKLYFCKLKLEMYN